MQPHFHAPTAGGNYPLAQAEGVIAGGSHQMCLGGTMTAYMGNAGTHPVQGNAASLVCPPEYTDLSAGVDCSMATVSAGACGAEDHGAHDHPTTSPDPSANGLTHVQWLAGFGTDAAAVAARSKTAHVGDSLHFMWGGDNAHNVHMMANKAAFDSCDFTGATNLGAVSPVEYKLTALPTYFACQIPGHCAAGQKLAVTADADAH